MEFYILAISFCLLLVAAYNTEHDDVAYSQKRWEMVESQIISRGVSGSEIIEAMLKIPRHEFVPGSFRHQAYLDCALPIHEGQTISQPYIVAYITELLSLSKGDKVLEIGTGSGYQAAILAEIGCEVYTIEIMEPLSKSAETILSGLGYKNIHYKVGDGYKGWEEHAPYDAIVVTAAPPEIPEPLKAQLKENGRMVIPVGEDIQELILIMNTKEGLVEKRVTPVRFVPMVGEAQKPHQ
jgi:protein-L-isoaspartate(D-aspartate) O-methyltransferase